jgi:hypothetical protein
VNAQKAFSNVPTMKASALLAALVCATCMFQSAADRWTRCIFIDHDCQTLDLKVRKLNLESKLWWAEDILKAHGARVDPDDIHRATRPCQTYTLFNQTCAEAAQLAEESYPSEWGAPWENGRCIQYVNTLRQKIQSFSATFHDC